MNRIVTFLLVFLFSINLFSQEDYNLEKIANITFNEATNDVWGYVDENGIEYGIVGTQTATHILSLEDPTNPVERTLIPGSSSTWRDIKHWNDHLYVTTDSGDDGLLIVDMSDAPLNITFSFWKPQLAFGDYDFLLQTCHNLYIDENGQCYLAGCNISPDVNQRGILVLDIITDPMNPQLIGAETFAYSHDVVVRDNIMYCSEIYAPTITAYDITDPWDPIYLGSHITTSEFTHNAWLSDDSQYIFTTDERGNSNIDAYDISDLSNMERIDTYHPLETENLGVVPHNTHYIDGYLVTSWYTDGIVIVDAERPHNLVKVGAYDTWPDAHGGTNGCWGAYPWLPSGIVLASDRGYGFFVLQPTYTRACWLEGNIIDKDTNEPISGVQVQIQSNDLNRESSNATGAYATGQVTPGFNTITFSHPDYELFTAFVELSNGVVTFLDIEMCKRTFFNVTGSTVKSADGTPVAGGFVRFLRNDGETVDLQADDQGQFSATVAQGTYAIIAGSWGYLHKATQMEISGMNSITIELEEGYQDDFLFEQGWTVTGNASAGIWERGVPNGTTYDGDFSNANVDVDGDNGMEAFVTGNSDEPNVGLDDVDDGATILISPVMDLTPYNFPAIEYYTWFFNGGGFDEPNDDLTIELSNGTETVEVSRITESSSEWKGKNTIHVANHIAITDQMTIRFIAEDHEEGHLVEAGVDAFLVTDGNPSGTNEEELTKLHFFPNPALDIITVTDLPSLSDEMYVTIKAVDGRVVARREVDNGTIGLYGISSGLYIVTLLDRDEVIGLGKISIIK